MARVHQRVIAIVAAALFLLTSVGFSLAVIWETRQSNQTNQQQAQNQCTINSTAGSVETPPPVFKPTSSIAKLQAADLKVGTGQTAASGDCLQVKYLGSLAKDGTVFDENFDKNQLLEFQLGVGQVIPGWDQGLAGMKVGGERRLLIPSALAYGSQGGGTIPPNADLVFDIQLIKIGH